MVKAMPSQKPQFTKVSNTQRVTNAQRKTQITQKKEKTNSAWYDKSKADEDRLDDIINQERATWTKDSTLTVELCININGLKKTLAELRDGEGDFLQTIRRRGITRIYLTEAYLTGTQQEHDEIKHILEEHLGGSWTISINAYKDFGHMEVDEIGRATGRIEGQRKVGTAVFIKDDDRGPFKIYLGLTEMGIPTNNPNLADKEGRIQVISATERERDLHDTLLVYSPNSAADQIRMRKSREHANRIRAFKHWYKQQHPNRILSEIGDNNALWDIDDIYEMHKDERRTREDGKRAREKLKAYGGDMELPSITREESNMGAHTHFEGATDMIREFTSDGRRKATCIFEAHHTKVDTELKICGDS